MSYKARLREPLFIIIPDCDECDNEALATRQQIERKLLGSVAKFRPCAFQDFGSSCTVTILPQEKPLAQGHGQLSLVQVLLVVLLLAMVLGFLVLLHTPTASSTADVISHDCAHSFWWLDSLRPKTSDTWLFLTQPHVWSFPRRAGEFATMSQN